MPQTPGGLPSQTLLTLTQGTLLGMLGRREAEHASLLHRLGEVAEVTFTGHGVEAALLHPFCRVRVDDGDPGGLAFTCSLCGETSSPCGHAGATLLQWLELRGSFRRHGPGTVWRRGAAQPFLASTPSDLQEIDLTHLIERAEIEEAIGFQLRLRRRGSARVSLVDDRLEIRFEPLTGPARLVLAPRRALPHLLPALRALPGVVLEGVAGELEVSSERLHPRLKARVDAGGSVTVQPGFRHGDTFLTTEEASQREIGGFVLLGNSLHLPRPRPVLAASYFARGTVRLTGRAAAAYLDHDHFAFFGESWYEPEGELAECARFPRPELRALDLREDAGGDLRAVPLFVAQGREIPWSRLARGRESGFLVEGGHLFRTPSLDAIREAGFKITAADLRGDIHALTRLVASTGLATSGAEGRTASILAALGGPATTSPATPGLTSQLRPYQALGLSWLHRLYRTGLGALLADDMGLGKTHQAMALAAAVRAENPHARILVVTPRGVLDHWLQLLATYAPSFPVVVFHGAGRSLRTLPQGALVVTTYDVALRSLTALAETDWDLAVFDEAQRVKNPRTKGSRAVKHIPASFRLALTGTPIENRLLELWSVFDLVLPGYLGSERAFRHAYRNPGPESLARLRRQIAPFVLRREKSQVLDDLPEKSEEVLRCELAPHQREVYDRIEAEGVPPLLGRLHDRSSEIPYIHVFALLTRLKQVCDHPGLVDPRLKGSAAGKLEALDEILDQALAGDNRVVVFSQYVEMLDLLSSHLTRRRVPHLLASGRTSDRSAVVARFNSGTAEPVLLASLLAMGVGIDLTAASVVIHYDRWWNPARENQATDRVHRIGQRSFVQVFKLVSPATVEERIDALIQRKQRLAGEVVTPTDDVLRGLTREELAELLRSGESL